MTGKTATETMDELQARDEAPRQAMIFEQHVEHFIRQWAPSDRRENAEFCSQLTSIVRQTFLDAQAPVQKQMTDIMMRWPMAPLVIRDSLEKMTVRTASEALRQKAEEG